MYHVEAGTFYVLDASSAKALDAKQREGKKQFTPLLPGGNAYLLDTQVFDPLEHPDIDPGDPERGCSITFDPAISDALRLRLCSCLIEMGYSVSPYLTHLRLTLFRRDAVTEVVDRDIQHFLSHNPAWLLEPSMVQESASLSVLTHSGQDRLVTQPVDVTSTGDVWETTLSEMTLQEFAMQAFQSPLAYDTFTDSKRHFVLIVEEQQTILKKTAPLVLTFSLFVPAREKAICTWTMQGGVDTEQLVSIAKNFAPDYEARQVKGTVTPA